MRNDSVADARQLGMLFALVSLILHFWKGWHEAAVAAAVFLAVAFFLPKVLIPLDKAWRWMGEILGRVVGSVLLSVLFFVFLTPLSLLRRAFGSSGLELNFDDPAASFWVERKDETPDPKTWERQF